jgi:hypothetical protein
MCERKLTSWEHSYSNIKNCTELEQRAVLCEENLEEVSVTTEERVTLTMESRKKSKSHACRNCAGENTCARLRNSGRVAWPTGDDRRESVFEMQCRKRNQSDILWVRLRTTSHGKARHGKSIERSPLWEVTVKKLENKTAYYKETVKCRRLMRWPESQRRVQFHTAINQPGSLVRPRNALSFMELEGFKSCSNEMSILPIYSQMNPDHILTPYFFKIQCNGILTSMPLFPN